MKTEPLIRLSVFLGMLALMGFWEWRAPRRPYRVSKSARWASNLGLSALNVAVVRLALPAGAVGAAAFARAQGWGLLHLVEAPGWVAFAGSILALDLIIYFQHVMFHFVPLLWRLHRVHHVDLDFDVTTGVRFHPIEILLSMGVKIAAVLLIGPPVAAVVAFEVLLNATAMFSHGNVRVPERLDRVLRLFVVTPEMHRVHHSVIVAETNSNFGFNAPWWDRVFGTYRAQPARGHLGMTIGVSECDDPSVVRLDRALALPFTRGSRQG